MQLNYQNRKIEDRIKTALQVLNSPSRALLLLFLIGFSTSVFSTNYYVSTTGSNPGTLNDVSDPFATIQYIIDNYDLDAGDSIILADGTYSENDIVPESSDDGFVIYGSDSANVIFDNNSTAGQCWMEFSWDSDDITIENITVREYSDAAGGAISLHSTNTGILFKNCHFYKNNSTSYAGVIYTMWNGIEYEFQNCSFESNTSTQHGAVFYTNYDNGIWNYTDCIFKNNQAGSGSNYDGGVFYISSFTSSSTMALNRCYFFGNVADDGSVAFNAGGCTMTFTNCLLYENVADDHGVLYAEETSNAKYVLMNCTVAENVSNDGFKGGGIVTSNDILDSGAGVVDATNCIIYGNTNYDMREAGGSEGVIDCDYCIYGSYSGGGSVTNSSGATDPEFVSAADDNYDIETTSAARNAATETGAPSVDITNTARDVGNYDIGAYEQGNGPVSCVTPTTQATVSGNSTLDSVGVTLTWTRGNGDQVLIIVREGNSTVTDPTDGTDYTANTVFGSGNDLGSNSYAVYKGSATSASITGLSYATTYYVEFFEQETTGDCYHQTPLTYNFTTDSSYIYVNDGSTTGDIWCSAAGNDATGAGSASAPYLSLSKAFAEHNMDAGSVIRLDKGTYNTSAENDIDPDDTDDDFVIIGADTSTLIDPLGSSRVFYFDKNGDVTLKNFKIANTTVGSDGAGIYYQNNENNTTSSLVLSGMVMANIDASGVAAGGAVFLADEGTNTRSDFSAVNCSFYGNSCADRGGAIHLEGSSSGVYSLSNCLFKHNVSSSNGFALHILEGNSTLTNCLFYENSAGVTADGALYIQGSGSHTMWNCTVADNSGDDGGITVNNATLTANNCISWGNSNSDLDADGAATFNFNYGCYPSGHTEGSITIDGNSITSDPAFVDASNDIYDIDDTSPCVDDGNNTGAPSDDITGTIRLGGTNTIVDMGAYEMGNHPNSCPLTLTWDGSTDNDWDDPTNWDLNKIPCGKDVVIADVANYPVLNTKGDCRNLTIDGAAILTWSSSDSLLVSGDLDVNSTGRINHTGTGVLSLSGTTKNFTVDPGVNISSLPITVSGSYTFVNSMTFDSLIITGTVDLTGGQSYDLSGSVVNSGTLSMSSASMLLEGDFNNTGTFDDGTSTVTFDGSSDAEIDGSALEFYNLIVNKNASDDLVSTDDAVTVSNDYTNTDGLFKIAGGTLDIEGILNIDGGEIWLETGTLIADDATVDMDGGVLDVDAGTVDFYNNGTSTFDFDMSAGTVEAGGGTWTIEDDLNIAGGKFEISGATLTISDGDAGSNAGAGPLIVSGGELEMNSGTLDVGDGTHEQIIMNAGVFDVNGGTINVINEYAQTGGTYEQSGGTLNLGVHSNGGMWDLSGGSYELTGGSIVIDNGMGALNDAVGITSAVTMGTISGGTIMIQADDETTYFDIAAGKSIYNVTIDNTTEETGSKQDLEILGDLTITSGQLDLSLHNQSIYIGGNWTNNASNDDGLDGGSFNPGTGSVIFNGTDDQIIGGTNSVVFNDLTLNKPDAGVDKVTLNVATGVVGNLSLTDGQLWSTWSNKLTVDFDSDAAQDIIGGDDTSYISGPVIIENYKASGSAYADTLKVPVGDGIYYAPVYIIPSGTGENDWQVRYADTSARALGGICAGSNVNKVSAEDRFHIDRLSGVEDAKIRLYWNSNSDITSSAGINDLIIGHWDATNCWEATNEDTSLFTRDYNGKWIETEFNVTEYSPFAFASRYGTVLLPVELLSFEAELVDGEVELEWVVASELNCDFYSVQRKADGSDWKDIGQVEGFGTSSMSQFYDYRDETPLLGLSHYRLVQVDYDSTKHESDVISIRNSLMSDVSEFRVMGGKNGIFAVEMSSEKASSCSIRIVNIAGAVVYSTAVDIIEGDNRFMLNLGLPKGLYYVVAENDVDLFSSKLLVH